MCKAIRASVLVLLFAGSAYAGDMQNDVKGPPPPAPITQEEQTAAGDIQNDAPDSLTETVMVVLESVLALF